jgi:hypothetical protein
VPESGVSGNRSMIGLAPEWMAISTLPIGLSGTCGRATRCRKLALCVLPPRWRTPPQVGALRLRAWMGATPAGWPGTAVFRNVRLSASDASLVSTLYAGTPNACRPTPVLTDRDGRGGAPLPRTGFPP